MKFTSILIKIWRILYQSNLVIFLIGLVFRWVVLDLDPISWNDNDQYKIQKNLIHNLHVVNDVTER